MPFSPVGEHFGRRLWFRRRQAGLSQEELGRLIGSERTEISRFERGLQIPRLDTILKLAAGVEVSPCDLVAGLRWCPGSRDRVGGAYPGFDPERPASEKARRR